MKILKIVVILSLFTLLSCGSESTNSSTSKCKYGTPKAIFSEDIPSVNRQEFQVEGQKGTENIIFDSGKRLEILQSGCNEMNQEYRFHLRRTMESDWVDMATTELLALADLSEKLSSYRFWAGEIGNQKDNFKLGEALEIQPNIYVSIDRIDSSNETLLIIVLSQKD